MKKFISIVTPCYNEEDNVEEISREVRSVMGSLPQYDYEHIFIDNDSRDRTQELLRKMAAEDKRIKVIINSRNFGHIRSPFYGILQAEGDAVIFIVCDFQDPPSLIPDFIKKWEEGHRIVIGVKTTSNVAPIMHAVRSFYYRLLNRLSEIELVNNFTGFGLYDKSVIQTLRRIHDPYPYFRGLISEIGFFPHAVLEYDQPARRRGFSKNNFYTLYDMALLGITNHSKVPLRMATMIGFISSILFFIIATGYLVAKLLFWQTFQLGLAPLIIGIFFTASVQLFFIGILGEYIGSIHTKVMNRPLVVEKERINFDSLKPENV
jgi:glycosyltransferase involved in cell wall biosynthesis